MGISFFLQGFLAALDGDGPVCVVTSWTLGYLNLEERAGFTDALTAVIGIALGVLLGTAAFRAGKAGVDEALRTLPPAIADRRWPRRRGEE